MVFCSQFLKRHIRLKVRQILNIYLKRAYSSLFFSIRLAFSQAVSSDSVNRIMSCEKWKWKNQGFVFYRANLKWPALQTSWVTCVFWDNKRSLDAFFLISSRRMSFRNRWVRQRGVKLVVTINWRLKSLVLALLSTWFNKFRIGIDSSVVNKSFKHTTLDTQWAFCESFLSQTNV
jgi:hypothetical protein